MLLPLLVSLLTVAHARVQTVNGKIKLEIGVTSRCGDAHDFINAFAPVYEKYERFLDVEFVPWARTQRVENELRCQFGVEDCWANRVQRCVLDALPDRRSAVEYMLCEFTRPLPAYSGSYSCARAMGLRLVDVDYCVSTTGEDLDRRYEAKATEPMRIVGFVPYVVVNGVADFALSESVRLGAERVICAALGDDPSTGVDPATCPT
ncbi:GILT-like protein F37H8.5 [Pieris napi]|uniref:GILT-like protein F37H8.5 n=1 Tax=Pieris napi TaxID=78633 RepID=UPI001FB9D94C|nr:GILT-like protein F37H8.5 [Pieris napi]